MLENSERQEGDERYVSPCWTLLTCSGIFDEVARAKEWRYETRSVAFIFSDYNLPIIAVERSTKEVPAPSLSRFDFESARNGGKVHRSPERPLAMDRAEKRSDKHRNRISRQGEAETAADPADPMGLPGLWRAATG
jgi:hypothetical protein